MQPLFLFSVVFLILQPAEGTGTGSSKHLEGIQAVATSDSLTGWDLPLPYFGSTVTAAKIMMNATLVQGYDSDEHRDHIIVNILGQGPIHWSISRFNRGDLDPLLQPRRPYAQSNLGVAGTPNAGFSASSPLDFSVQAWRPSVEFGVLLASVAQNGQEWNDGTPRFYGTVACPTNSMAYGYQMESGEFGKENPTVHVKVGKAGQMGEGNIDVAIAWFPYAQGWVGGYLDQPQKESFAPPNWQFLGAHSPSLPDTAGSLIEWGNHGASFKLPGVDPATDGMLFTASTDPSKENTDVNTVSVYVSHRKKEWRVQQHEDSTDDATQLVKPSQMMFSFVYIPWTAGGLIGGNIEGVSGHVLKGKGLFKVHRYSVGQYEISIGGPHEAEWWNDSKTEQDGILLLQVLGRDDANRKYAKNVFLSFNYTNSGTLFVEARHLVKLTDKQEDFPLVDTDFSFVWVDFKHPLTPDSESFSGFFGKSASPSASDFWMGVFSAILTILLVGGVSVGVYIYLQFRSQSSPFHVYPETDMTELGTDLLRSDFKFSE